MSNLSVAKKRSGRRSSKAKRKSSNRRVKRSNKRSRVARRSNKRSRKRRVRRGSKRQSGGTTQRERDLSVVFSIPEDFSSSGAHCINSMTYEDSMIYEDGNQQTPWNPGGHFQMTHITLAGSPGPPKTYQNEGGQNIRTFGIELDNLDRVQVIKGPESDHYLKGRGTEGEDIYYFIIKHEVLNSNGDPNHGNYIKTSYLFYYTTKDGTIQPNNDSECADFVSTQKKLADILSKAYTKWVAVEKAEAEEAFDEPDDDGYYSTVSSVDSEPLFPAQTEGEDLSPWPLLAKRRARPGYDPPLRITGSHPTL